jgi:hypothetical protein
MIILARFWLQHNFKMTRQEKMAAGAIKQAIKIDNPKAF